MSAAGAADPVVVGRVGRAHGIRGELAVVVSTDVPETRFAPGAVLATQPAERGPLTVAGSRLHSGRLLVRFVGVSDRGAAEQLAGTVLVIDATQLGDPGENAWWDHQLIGLPVELADGRALGLLREVLHAPGQDLLAVHTPAGREVLVPFLAAFVPTVDLVRRRIVVDPPPGLLDL